MKIKSLQVSNFRSVVKLPTLALGQITVLIGPNNAGKSSLLRALYAMQQGVGDLGPDRRLGTTESVITLEVEAPVPILTQGNPGQAGTLTIRIAPGPFNMVLSSGTANISLGNPLPARAPDHFIVPYLSKRKAIQYNEDVREQHALEVGPQFTFLAAKLSRLGNSAFPGHDQYANSCKAILGFVVTAIPSQNGLRPGIYLPDATTIPIEQMGEGVPNIVGLLADLALSREKLFLLEEPENDLHPSALKALLDLVVESSEFNQFVVSTHSHIVARHLASTAGSRLYYVDSEPGQLPPITHVKEIAPEPTARMNALRELGYALSDFELWDGWLILEESSAERIIRDYLVPFFAPGLSRARTLSAGSNSQVEPTFQDFHRLVRFTHLEEAYRDRAWVLVDGDDDGRAIVQRLRETYSSWSPSQFDFFESATFESYYPADFQQEAAAALAISDKQDRRAQKRKLLEDVRAWLDEDMDRAKAALESSAAPIIMKLREIEERLIGGS